MAPSGKPLDGEPAAPRPKNHNAPFRGLGSTMDAKSGSGGRSSRTSSEACEIAEARKAARVRRGG
jgi:hypothetical protein